MRMLVTLLLLAAPAAAQEFYGNDSVLTEYNRFSDATTVSTKNLRLLALNQSRLSEVSLTFSFTYPGRTPPRIKPTKFIALFSGQCGTCFSLLNDLIFLAGSNRLDLGSGLYLSDGTVETVGFSLTRKQLQTLVKAKKAEFQLGTFQSQIEFKGIAAIAALLNAAAR